MCVCGMCVYVYENFYNIASVWGSHANFLESVFLLYHMGSRVLTQAIKLDKGLYSLGHFQWLFFVYTTPNFQDIWLK